MKRSFYPQKCIQNYGVELWSCTHDEARALVAYLAVEETEHSAADVARYLGIGRANVLRSIKRGCEICKKYVQRNG